MESRNSLESHARCGSLTATRKSEEHEFANLPRETSGSVFSTRDDTNGKHQWQAIQPALIPIVTQNTQSLANRNTTNQVRTQEFNMVQRRCLRPRAKMSL